MSATFWNRRRKERAKRKNENLSKKEKEKTVEEVVEENYDTRKSKGIRNTAKKV